MNDVELGAARAEINVIDNRLMEVLRSRSRVVRRIQKMKRAEGELATDPQREREIIDRMKALNTGYYSNDCIVAIWNAILLHAGDTLIDGGVDAALAETQQTPGA